MTDLTAQIRNVHASVTAEREQQKLLVEEQHARMKGVWRRRAATTLRALEIASVKAAHEAADLARLDASTAKDCLDALAARVRALPCLPKMAQHFRAAGVDVTADQLADQIIASMRAVTDGRVMSALPRKADHS